MSALLLTSLNKENEELIIKLAKALHTPLKQLNEEEELDALLIESIEKGMKSGKASKKDAQKLFARHGVRIH